MKKLPEGHLGRYDWSRASRGRVAKRLVAEGSNLRALDDDLAEEFPDSASVNDALRASLAIRRAVATRSTGGRRPRRAA